MRYVAFLRAVNVGRRVVKMQALTAAFESLRLSNVQTFIASGNVIFETATKDLAALERKIETRLREVFGFEIDTFVRSVEELEAIAECRPYRDAASGSGGDAVYVGFLRDAPGPAARRKVEALCNAVDDFHVDAREVFWLCRKSAVHSKTSGAGLEKALGLRGTFRNVRTVKRIAEKYS